MSDADLPAYFVELPLASDDALWAHMQARFEDLWDIVANCRLETEAEALGRRHVDPSGAGSRWVGGVSAWRDSGEDLECEMSSGSGGDMKEDLSVRPWNLIPFIKEIDQRDLTARQAIATRLAAVLERQLKDRLLSPQFLAQWGAFCAAAGALELAYLSQPGDVRSRRFGESKGLHAQKKWVAIQLLDLMNHGQSRADAEAVVVRRLRDILDDAGKRAGFPEEWFRKIVAGGRTVSALRPAFTSSGNLSKSKLQTAAKSNFPVPETSF